VTRGVGDQQKWLSLNFDSILALSGGVAGSLNQEAEEVGWRIGHRWGAGWAWRIAVGAVGPEVSADGGERVAEGGFWLGVPSGLARREVVGMRGVGHEDHHAEEAEEAGRGAADGAGGPLALGLQTQVRSCFLAGDFDVPPVELGGQDRQGLDRRVGAEERVGREPPLRVAHQDPADGQRCAAVGVPQRGAGGHVERSPLVSVPGDDLPLPGGVAGCDGGGVQSVDQLACTKSVDRMNRIDRIEMTILSILFILSDRSYPPT